MYSAEIRKYLDFATSLIAEAYTKNPKSRVFDQVGLLAGKEIVLNYMENGEHCLAMEHLLYMVHESEIEFPQDKLHSLHEVAKSMKVQNCYDQPADEEK